MSRAYNTSIYLMIGIPYTMMGLVGVMVYRHLRVRAAANPLPVPGQDNSQLPHATGQSPC